MSNQDYPYDVALSFAGEDREYARELAQALKARNINVFYDEYEESKLWGKNLYTYLSEMYQKQASFCVMFLSQHYKEKLWTNHEREAAQARAFQENKEYILPIRLDNTEIPGILPTIGYLTWSNANSIANNIVKKLQQETPSQRQLDSVTKANLEDVVASEKGVDYTRLRDLLKARLWQEADQETFQVMLKAANGQQQGDWVQISSIETFPCTDLCTIDRLWKKYSNEHFGFSVQTRIWDSFQKRTLFVPIIDDYDSFVRDMEIVEKFSERVGWRKNMLMWKEWLEYDDLTFNTKAPYGHLPTVPNYRSLFSKVRRGLINDGEKPKDADKMCATTWFHLCDVFFSRTHDCLL